jgi:predicted transcriptional regulator
MPKTANELLDIKDQIEKADKRKSELQGQIKELLSRLKKDHGCSSGKEGDKKLEKMQLDLEKMQDKLDKGTADLQEKMEEVDED